MSPAAYRRFSTSRGEPCRPRPMPTARATNTRPISKTPQLRRRAGTANLLIGGGRSVQGACRVRYSSSCAGFSWSPRRSVIGNRRSRVQKRRVLARKRRLLHRSRRSLITVIDNRSGRHLLGSWRHDLPVRQSVPKWRTLQVFDEWKGCRGAGEWTRTTDLLITNKLLRSDPQK